MNKSIDEQFDAPRQPISIVCLQDGDMDAQALRAVLEAMTCVVTIHWIGTPADFLRVLGYGETAPRYMLIAGHGDHEKGYYFQEYADCIDTSMLQGRYMPADVIAPVVNLPGCTVLSLACGGGAEAMGRAFVQAGKIRAYIGCRTYPGDDMLIFLVNFFHGILCKKLSDRDAWHRAMVVTDHEDIYAVSFFHGDGTEEHYEQITESAEKRGHNVGL